VARAEFPLDFDRRQTLTGIVRTRISDHGGPTILGLRILGGLETAAIARVSTGLPYSRTNAAGDSLVGLPNSVRLPTTYTVDLLVRRPLRIGGTRGGLYFDVRNLLNRRNLIAVRRDTGVPGPSAATITQMAETAYLA